MRIALGIEYDGRHFHGWQTQQAGVRTVQQVVEQAVAAVANHQVRVHCAGRTDTGVHALEQVIHFETDVERPIKAWVLGVNANLPDDVAVLWAKPVETDFHARFSATARSYRYLILNRKSRSALLAGRATWVHRSLDETRMQRAAETLLGTHDFSSYRALGCQAKSPVRTLRRLNVTRQGEIVMLHVEANAFLHHMVRNLAGVLIAIGKGDAETGWARQVLELKDRTLGGVTAPPDGLYFECVNYPDMFVLPFVTDRNPWII